MNGLRKSELKEPLFLATKDWHFIFHGTHLYKQIDGVAIVFPLDYTLASAF